MQRTFKIHIKAFCIGRRYIDLAMDRTGIAALFIFRSKRALYQPGVLKHSNTNEHHTYV